MKQTAWRKAYLKSYRKKNKKRIKTQRREYYLKHREQELEKNNAWNNLHIDVLRIQNLDRVRKSREDEALKFLKRRQIERKYRARRKELYQKRKAEGYYQTPEYKAKMSAYYLTDEYRERERHKKQKMKANAQTAIEGTQRRV